MKHPEIFIDFLEKSVNLNSTRLIRLEQKVGVVESQIISSAYKPKILDISIHGSYAHGTIIKPPKLRHSFDADMALYIREQPNWSPKDYIDRLYYRLKEISHYSKIVSRSTRCVTIDYADDFHLDIVPIIQRNSFLFTAKYKICNRRDNIFEQTDGPGFDDWLDEKNEILDDDYLIKVTRLLKYLRDIKGRFSCKSILLTTLIATQVQKEDHARFSDLGSALTILIGRLDDFLEENPKMPIIENPVLVGENFNRHWDSSKYSTFRTHISMYRTWIDDAYSETEPELSVLKWRKVFGDGFGSSVDLHSKKFLSQCQREVSDLENDNSGSGLWVIGATAAAALLLALKG